MANAHTRTSNIAFTGTERAELVSMVRSRSLPAALALRAHRLGMRRARQGQHVSRKGVGIDRNTVNKWRARYARARISGLYDELRPGRPRTVDDERVAELINTTLHTKPADGSTHWSTRGLASETGISKTRWRATSRSFSSNHTALRASNSRPIHCSLRSCAVWWVCT